MKVRLVNSLTILIPRRLSTSNLSQRKEAYQNVMQTNTNQSILITEETGADRTKYTNRVVTYCATICPTDQPSDGNLEK